MIALKLEEIKSFLDKKGLKPTIQKETNQVLVLNKANEYEFPLFFRIMDSQELLQLLMFLPCNVKEETLADLCRLLHFINREMDLPGFGIDEEAKVVFYRLMLPAEKHQISDKIFETYVQATTVVAETFFPIIVAVTEGMATFQEIYKQITEAQAE